jgi:hypothetical protein
MMTTKLVNEYAIALRDILYLFSLLSGVYVAHSAVR